MVRADPISARRQQTNKAGFVQESSRISREGCGIRDTMYDTPGYDMRLDTTIRKHAYEIRVPENQLISGICVCSMHRVFVARLFRNRRGTQRMYVLYRRMGQGTDRTRSTELDQS